MKNVNRAEIFTENIDLKIFEILVPEINLIRGKMKSIDSPISKGRNCFSVYYWRGKYWFKDHSTGKSGDIFEFIAIKNNLNSRSDFPGILQIIQTLLDNHCSDIPESEKICYKSKDAHLILASHEFSKLFIKNNLSKAMPFLDSPVDYKMHLVERYIPNDNGNIKSQYVFDYAKPNEALYALCIEEDCYYILFNPKTSIIIPFGVAPEYYQFGFGNMLKTAYQKNIYLRETIIITNTVESVLWCEDKGIPCLALLNDEVVLPDYFEQVILPKFSSRYLLIDNFKNGYSLIEYFVDNFEFQNIKYKENRLIDFLKTGEQAIESIFSLFVQKEEYEYEGRDNKLQIISNVDELI